MKKIENARNLCVTFSKRRSGFFKKASEFSTLCGGEILLLVFSPGKKVFSFGHPSVENLIDRFFNPDHNSVIPHHQNNNQQLVESRPVRTIQYLNERHAQVLADKENEKHKKKTLEKMIEARERNGNWYEKTVKELNPNETNHLICALQDLKKQCVNEMSQHSQVNVSQNYLGESSGFSAGNVDVGTDLFDQRRNTFNYNPNMAFPNHTPLLGFNNDHAPMFGYNNDYTPLYGYNNDYTPLLGYNNDYTPLYGYNNDGVIVPSSNTDGVSVPRSNNDEVIVPSSNINDMSSYNFNQS